MRFWVTEGAALKQVVGPESLFSLLSFVLKVFSAHTPKAAIPIDEGLKL